MKLVAVSAGESETSKTRALARAAITMNAGGELIDLHELPADALLGRVENDHVADAVAASIAADVLVVATPVYRATYTGALKAFFDRFPYGALSNTAVVLAATAGAAEHFLSLDTGMRAMIASLSGWSVPTVVYATGDDFVDGEPAAKVVATLGKALEEAAKIADVLRVR